MLVIILWGLWNIMNKIGVGKRFPHSSIEIFVKKLRFVQRWRILLNVQDANSLDDKINRLKTWLKLESLLKAN